MEFRAPWQKLFITTLMILIDRVSINLECEQWKYNMRFTIPNILTFIRLLAAPCVAIFLILDLNAVIALSIFLLASITDYLDGYLARTLNQSTSLGKVLDPVADKAMVIITLCFLNYSFENTLTRLFFGIPAAVIIFREIFVSGLREYVGRKSDLLSVLDGGKVNFNLSDQKAKPCQFFVIENTVNGHQLLVEFELCYYKNKRVKVLSFTNNNQAEVCRF